MLFLTYEKSNYELVRKLLSSNFSFGSDISIDALNRGMVVRAQDLGFTKIEDYSQYLMMLPYRQVLCEFKSLILSFQPVSFQKNKPLLDSLTQSEVMDLLIEIKNGNGSKKASSAQWLKKVLTTEIKFKPSQEIQSLKVMGVESASGEEIYHTAMKLASILPDNVEMKLFAVESDSNLLRRAEKAEYNEGKLANFSSNYRALYFEKNENDQYKIVEKIRQHVRFLNFDILSTNLGEEHIGKYHIILCNNLPHFYPVSILKMIIERIIPFLVFRGFLLVSLPKDAPYLTFKGLDIQKIGENFIYRRNSEELLPDEGPLVSRFDDSIENRLIFSKALFLNNRLDLAEKEINRVLDEHIDDIAANYFLGDILVKKGMLKKALKQYSKTLIIQPNFLPSLFNIAALNLLTRNRDEAVNTLEKLMNPKNHQANNCLKDYFNIEMENFLGFCGYLRDSIDSPNPPALEELMEKSDYFRKEKTIIPNLNIPDTFKKKHEGNKTDSNNETLEPVEKKVVYISELPSTRDYGEHDPWKIKQDKDALLHENADDKGESLLKKAPDTEEMPDEEQKEEKSEGVKLSAEEIPSTKEDSVISGSEEKEESPGTQTIETAEDKIPGLDSEAEPLDDGYTISTFSSGPIKSSLSKDTSVIEKAGGYKIRTQVNARPKALFLDNVSIKSLNLPKSFLEKMHHETEEKPEIKSQNDSASRQGEITRACIEPKATSVIETEDRDLPESPVKESSPQAEPAPDVPVPGPIILKDETLPTWFVNELKELVKKDDINGILELAQSASHEPDELPEGSLKIIIEMCGVFQKRFQSEKKPDSIQGKRKEFKDNLDRFNALIQNNDLLEASMLLQRLLTTKAAVKSFSPNQEQRLRQIKETLEIKIERYQEFIEDFFTDPVNEFQVELWEALSRITSREGLLETGVKHGLDPKYIPGNLINY